MFLWPQSNPFSPHGSTILPHHNVDQQDRAASASFSRVNFVRLHQNILNSLMQIKNLDLVPAPAAIQENLNSIIFRQGLCLWPGCGKLGFTDNHNRTKHLLSDHACCFNTTLQVEMAIKNLSNITSEVFESFQVLQACLAHLDRLVNSRTKLPQSNEQNSSGSQDNGSKYEAMLPPVKPIPFNYFPQQAISTSINSFFPSPRPSPRFPPAFNIFLPSRAGPAPNTGRAMLPEYLNSPGNSLYPRYVTQQVANAANIMRRGNPSAISDGISNPQTFPSTIRKERRISNNDEAVSSKKRKRVRDPREENSSSELEDPGTRQYYRSNDERPPFTYIDLIRQAIIESSPKGLPLVDIYNWIQNEFIYYRKNQMRWKNAVRHNLSLHKCFQRIGEHKGGIWVINDEEYSVRRPHRPAQRKYQNIIEDQEIPNPLDEDVEIKPQRNTESI